MRAGLASSVIAFAVLVLLAACQGSQAPGTAGDEDAASHETAAGDANEADDVGPVDVVRLDEGTQDEDVPIQVDVGPQDCPGGFMCPCQFNEECDSNFCIEVDAATGERVCTMLCIDECPEGWGCQTFMIGSDAVSICMPANVPLCNRECVVDGDCAGPDDLCVAMENHQFCLQACGPGYEDCPEGFECSEISNWDGSRTLLQCVPLSGHCWCDPDVDYMTDTDHCGSCENACAYDHGVPDCQDGACRLIGCEEGWVNLNGLVDDGCEYECTYQGADDPPDLFPDEDGNFHDDNCDGIDGDIDKGVFVDAENGDDDNVLGDMAHPFKTIGAALAFADADPYREELYVSKGQYREQVRLKNGIGVYGGYDSAKGWKRDVQSHKTAIMWDGQETMAVRAVVAQEIIDETVFNGFFVKASSAIQPSSSSYGMYIFHSSSALVVANNHIEAGNGADGRNGLVGTNGGNGNDGGNGSGSFEYDGCLLCACNDADYNISMKPGEGGKSPCGNPGGKGGRGGKHEDPGFAGEDAPNNGGKGGAGAADGSLPGASGGNGADGTPGQDGAGGVSAGSLSPAGLWVPGPGKDGQDGVHGKGGGGGGGGGGDTGCFLGFCCDTAGGAGGGGGGGGCGGTGGEGGTGGGSSFGLFILEASPQVLGNVIVTGSGGNGGNGGAGGEPGIGGAGGYGGPELDDNAGAGGDGGRGGNGGRGGDGGGGAGGSSFGMYIVGSSSNPSCADNVFELDGFPGAGGSGGSGTANKGENGMSGEIWGGTADCQAP